MWTPFYTYILYEYLKSKYPRPFCCWSGHAWHFQWARKSQGQEILCEESNYVVDIQFQPFVSSFLPNRTCVYFTILWWLRKHNILSMSLDLQETTKEQSCFLNINILSTSVCFFSLILLHIVNKLDNPPDCDILLKLMSNLDEKEKLTNFHVNAVILYLESNCSQVSSIPPHILNCQLVTYSPL